VGNIIARGKKEKGCGGKKGMRRAEKGVYLKETRKQEKEYGGS